MCFVQVHYSNGFLPGSGLTTFFLLPLISQKSVDATPRLLKTSFCHYNLDCRDRIVIVETVSASLYVLQFDNEYFQKVYSHVIRHSCQRASPKCLSRTAILLVCLFLYESQSRLHLEHLTKSNIIV